MAPLITLYRGERNCTRSSIYCVCNGLLPREPLEVTDAIE